MRAFTRDRKKIKIDHAALEIYEGQLSSYNDLLQAMAKQDGVYSLQPILEDVEEEVRQGKMIIQAAKEQAVQHFVCSTAGGVNRNRASPHFAALAEIENVLKSSGLNHTIIQPSFFMDNFKRIVDVTGNTIKIPEFINPDVKFSMISSIDIAGVVAEVFNNPIQYNEQVLEIAADELTLKEVVETFSSVFDRAAVIEGSFNSATAERAWLEEKGYIIDFNQMDLLIQNRLTLEKWLTAEFEDNCL